MRNLERRYSKIDRVIAKARFSVLPYIKTLILAGIFGGLIAVIWFLGPMIFGMIIPLVASLLARLGVEVNISEETILLIADIVKYCAIGIFGSIVVLDLARKTIDIFARELILTENKVIYRKGLFRIKEWAISVDNISLITVKKGLIQRIFGDGHLTFVSDTLQNVPVKDVRAASRFMDKVMNQVSVSKEQAESRRVQLKL